MDDLGNFIVVIFFAIAFNLLIAFHFTTKAWEAESVKLGHAEYSQTTGEWQWKKIEGESK